MRYGLTSGPVASVASIGRCPVVDLAAALLGTHLPDILESNNDGQMIDYRI
jgi:hypothetical protein